MVPWTSKRPRIASPNGRQRGNRGQVDEKACIFVFLSVPYRTPLVKWDEGVRELDEDLARQRYAGDDYKDPPFYMWANQMKVQATQGSRKIHQP
jgi:hypothetical protein